MGAPQFTPGPWRTVPSMPNAIFASDEAGTKVAATTAGHAFPRRPEHESRANARLIAAAPQLLDALKYLVAHCKRLDRFEGNPINQAIADAREAIAAATEDACP